jgi:hypothetical protein
MGLSQQQVNIEQAYRQGLISNQQRELALQELAQRQQHQVALQQLSQQDWYNRAQIAARQQEIEAQKAIAAMNVYGRSMTPQVRWYRNW